MICEPSGPRRFIFALLKCAACLALALGALPVFAVEAESGDSLAMPEIVQLPLPLREGQTFVIDDFNNDVTSAQLRTNALSGPNGLIAAPDDVGSISWSDESSGLAGGSLRLNWNFAQRQASAMFVGVYFAFFGPSEASISLDGKPPAMPTRLPGYALNTTNFFGSSAPGLWPGRLLEELRVDVKAAGEGTVLLKVELADDAGRLGFSHVPVIAGGWQTLSLSLAPNAWQSLSEPLDFTQLKRVSLLVEQQVGESVNPPRGEMLFDNLALVDRDGMYPDLDLARGKPEYARAFLEYVRATSFLYFLDFASREPNCGGMVRDRGTFPELMTAGGAGFQLSAYAIAAERQYLSRDEAAARALRLITLLHEGPQGPERLGTIGYKGFFYHFLGVDGRRKLNYDLLATSDISESMNTVELSTIDTAIAVCGVLAARQYFDSAEPVETELRRRADAIYARVDWRFMLEPRSNQFYLAWKPEEHRDNRGSLFGRFAIDDADASGQYASKIEISGGADGSPVEKREAPATIDYYTDEAILIALLAIAAPDPEKRVDASTFFAPLRERLDGPFVRSFSGSLFTYQFASCWLDTRALGPDRDPAGIAPPINYFENTRAAIRSCIDYAARNPRGHVSLSGSRFGLSACDGPFEAYFPEAAPPLALMREATDAGQRNGPRGLEVGTLTTYAVGSSILHAPRQTIDALWECQRLGLLHPRVGFADAFNLDIADAVGAGTPTLLRSAGRWSHPVGFAIDHGPMLILIDSYLEDRFVPKLFMSHSNIKPALAKLFPDWKPE